MDRALCVALNSGRTSSTVASALVLVALAAINGPLLLRASRIREKKNIYMGMKWIETKVWVQIYPPVFFQAT